MAIDFPGGVEDYEGGSDEGAINSSNTDYDVISGSPVFDSAHAMRGALSGRYASAGAITSTGRTFTARNVIFDRAYVLVEASPAAAMYVMGCNSGGTIRAQNRINADRTITVRNGTTAVFTSTTVLATNTWYRLERHIDLSAGTQETKIFLGHDATELETSGSVAAPSGVTADRVAYGNLTAVTGTTVWVDDVTSNNGAGGDGFPGPSLVITPVAASDSATQTEGTTQLTQGYTGTDTQTLTGETSALAITTDVAASDSFTQVELSADTELDDAADIAILTEVASVVGASIAVPDTMLQGDQLVNSIQTGKGSITWGGAIFLNQVVVAEVDAAAWNIGDKFLVYVGSTDAIAETKVFKVQSKSGPFAGFVNMFADQNFEITTAPDAGDWIREVVPAGAFLDMSTDLTDAATVTDGPATVTAAATGVDTFTVSEAAVRHSVGNVVHVSETDVARPVGRLRTDSVTFPSETDAALPMARRRSRAVVVVPETDAALTLVDRHSRTAGTALETDAAVAITALKTRVVGTTTTTDAALAVADTVRSRLLGFAAEVDAAGALPLGTGVHVADEQDEARTIVARKVKSTTTTPAEIDVGLPLAVRHSRTLPTAAELDAATGFTTRRTLAVTRADEVDEATALPPRFVRTLGTATETDVGVALAGAEIKTLTRVDETDVAITFARVRLAATGLAEAEVDEAVALEHDKSKPVPVVVETDAARPIVVGVSGQPVAFRIRRSGREGVTSGSGEEPGTLT